VNIEKIDKTNLYTLLCRCYVIIGKIDKTDLYTLLCRCFVIIGKIDKTDPSVFVVCDKCLQVFCCKQLAKLQFQELLEC